MDETPRTAVQEGFSNVAVQAADPALFFQILDMQAQNPAIIALRERAVALMDPAPGRRYLDVGSGTGEVVRSIAARGGAATGVDASPVMVEEARRRAGDTAGIDFAQGDAQALDFADATFDGVHCERVMQHLADPAAALAEFVRVAKPGARILVADTDWETAVLGPVEPDVGRRIRLHLASAFPNGVIGRHLYRLFREANLNEIEIFPQSMIFTEWDEQRGIGPPLAMEIERTRTAGILTDDEATAAIAALRSASDAGTLFGSVTMFLVSGTKT